MLQDFDLKIRLNNIFWSYGCYTRISVKLAEYTSKVKIPLELTDIDTLGIRILPDFTQCNLLGDCTSNKNYIKSPIKKVFWLKGVMEFMTAQYGYLSLKSDNPVQETQRLTARKLGITILNTRNLANLEKRVIKPDALELQLSKQESWLFFENNLTTLDKKLSNLLRFRKHDYWIKSKHQNLHAIISLTIKHRDILKRNNKFHRALIVDLLTLFTLSLLDMAAYVTKINPEDPEIELRGYFYGGYSEMKRRQKIVENIEKLIDLQAQKILFKKSLKLDPDYLPNMFDVAFRLLNKPHDAAQILRYLQMYLFEEVLYDGKNQEGLKFMLNFSDVTKKLTKDIIRLFCNATGLSEEFVPIRNFSS